MNWNLWAVLALTGSFLFFSACADRKDEPSCGEDGTNCADIVEPEGDVVADIQEEDTQAAEDVANTEDVVSVEDGVGAEDISNTEEDVTTVEDVESTPEDTEVQPPIDVEPTACSGVLDCVIAGCQEGDQECVDACLADASETAQSQAAPMLACLKDSCLEPTICDDGEDSFETSPDCFVSCYYLECPEAFQSCVDPESEGNGNCEDGIPCVLNCFNTPSPFGCISECFGQLSDDAKEKLAAFGECLYDPNLPEKGVDACIASAAECMGFEVGQGDKSCYETFMCVEENCANMFEEPIDGEEENESDENNGPPPCIVECLAEGTPEAAALVVSIFECDMNEEEIEGFPCEEELVTCAEPSGTLDCTGITECMEGCEQGGGNEMGCFIQCFHEASVQGVSDFFAAVNCPMDCQITCAEEADPDKCMQSCFETKCTPSFEACFAD